ncbi:hypothetical protein BSAE_1675 [Bifidobacterium pullorum subsp. saeculare DSM 6531 = LMG 14934]|uniref:Uncharacterized protein n=1 Tax=Bifidobacterium pullorum subsp. saeculare DSM 6531 = LMG 14934 TaxID=1437611 RepID=A0A087CTG2_9BIFI|nr:hypothetical protein BSAE_1675 [Bifidobacterium pullorum subsp. saeculare DSM 6531 = LMG 14934]
MHRESGSYFHFLLGGWLYEKSIEYVIGPVLCWTPMSKACPQVYFWLTGPLWCCLSSSQGGRVGVVTKCWTP